jgi:hypothetical protein
VSTRSLAWLALAFAVLLGLLGFVGAHRLGYLASAEVPQWEFDNALLDCKPGTIAQLNPGRVDQARQRFWFLRVFAEPDAADPSVAHSPVGRYAHMRAAVSEQRPREEGWFYQTASVFAFRQLGAVGPDEWLKEISVVRERAEDGGAQDFVFAKFANPKGAEMIYSYVLGESREERAQRGLGWDHMVQQARSISSEVYYLEPAGFQEPPPKAED